MKWGFGSTFRRFQRTFNVLGLLAIGMAVGALLLAYWAAGDIYDYQDTVDGVHLPRVDAIVCLAGGRGRIAAAGDIWFRYWQLDHSLIPEAGKDPAPPPPPVLYLSGMGHQANWNILSHQLRSGVMAVLRPEDVVLENESTNTDANAIYFARYARAHGWERVLLVTSRYHMKRSRFIFEHRLATLSSDSPVDEVEPRPSPRAEGSGLSPVKVETLSVYQEPFEPGEWRSSLHGIRVTVLEYLKWLYYRTAWKP